MGAGHRPCATELRRVLTPVHFPDEPFGWSGGNLAEERARARPEASQYLKKLIDQYPAAHQVIVAHSHGGSVAFAALAEPWFADRVLGVVTLGTPFITLERNPHKSPFASRDGIIAALFSGVAVFATGVMLGHGRHWWTYRLLTVGSWPRRWRSARTLFRRNGGTGAALRRTNTPYAAPAGASGHRPHDGGRSAFALFTARVASDLVWLAWERIIGPVERRLKALLKSIDYLGSRKGEREEIAARRAMQRLVEDLTTINRPAPQTPKSPLEWMKPVWPAAPNLPAVETPAEAAWKEPRKGVQPQLPSIIGVTLPPLLAVLENGSPWTRALAFLVIVGYGLPALARCLVAIATIPFGVILALGRLPCGWTLPLAGLYLDLSVEPAPPGAWSVTHFKASDEVISHSLAHNDPRVRRFAAEWIAARAAEVEHASMQRETK